MAFLIVLVDDDEEAVAKHVNEQSIVVHNNDSPVSSSLRHNYLFSK